MSMFRKPSQTVAGTKFLFFGETGTGKSLTGLSFPKNFIIDSEAGTTYYQNHPTYGQNILGVASTQNFNDTLEAFEEIGDMVEDDINSVRTLIIDSITKISNNLSDTVLQVEEKKARKKGLDVDDANISIRGYGRIKNIAQRIQNTMIDLSSKGCNIVFIAQAKPIKKKVGDQFIIAGYEPDTFKQSSFDFDVIVRTYSEVLPNGEIVYKGEVLKDRTNVCKKGQHIENVSYDIWKSILEGDNVGKIETSFSKDLDNAKDTLEKQDAELEKTVVDRLKDAMALGDVQKTKALSLIKESGIKNPLSPANAKELEKLNKIIDTLIAM